MTQPIQVEQLTKRFGRASSAVEVLRGIDLALEQGQFLAIMGASGSGKSTLLHLMAGLTTADAGRIVVDGQDLATLSDKQLTLFRRRRIGLVFQSFNLIPTLTAEQNVLLPLELDGRVGKVERAKAAELLDTLGLASRKHHRPDALSGGEQQRVAIGRALITDPAVILADEPTGNLDSANSRGVCSLLRDLSQIHGKTVVMVTHEPSVAAYASEVVVLQDGRIIDRFATADFGETHDLAARYQQAMR